MTRIRQTEPAGNALINAYRGDDFEEGAAPYTDCFMTTIDQRVSLADFVFAFYTTPLFRLERVILSALFGRPSSDAQARQVADGDGDVFAAWRVEGRADNQLLMCDFRSRTRSWFMVGEQTRSTTLYFGSVVVPLTDKKNAAGRPATGFSPLLGLHRLYSRALLHSATRRLARHRAQR